MARSAPRDCGLYVRLDLDVLDASLEAVKTRVPVHGYSEPPRLL